MIETVLWSLVYFLVSQLLITSHLSPPSTLGPLTLQIIENICSLIPYSPPTDSVDHQLLRAVLAGLLMGRALLWSLIHFCSKNLAPSWFSFSPSFLGSLLVARIFLEPVAIAPCTYALLPAPCALPTTGCPSVLGIEYTQWTLVHCPQCAVPSCLLF